MEHKQYSNRILYNGSIATMNGDEPYGYSDNSCLVISGDRIAWIGQFSDLPHQFNSYEKIDLEGNLVTPGLIDCHTHIVHAGNRAKEYEMRLRGASYEQIAQSGGGVVSTVFATRKSNLDELVELALPRLDRLISEGVCTLEVKSGYGLDTETELNMLRAARRLEQERPIHIRTSFLGAHALPPEYSNRAEAYLEEVCIPTLHLAHEEGLVDAVDGFCERIAFDTGQIERVFNEAVSLGIPVKLHAEQLSNSGGTQLIAGFNGLSADHIEYANEDDVLALKKAGSIAVLLPGAFYTLNEDQSPPIKCLRSNNVPMAIATDCNPGSSPMVSLLLAMNMGCTLFGLTPEEALLGTTVHAARALGLYDRGLIHAGQRADLCIWQVKHPAELSYWIGFNPLKARVFGGNFA